MKDIAKMQIHSQRMRRRSLTTALFLGVPLFLVGQSIAEDNPAVKGKAKPVPAYVAAHFDKVKTRSVHVNKAVIRSGPSDKYYATSTLLKEAVVEVYLETSDGWSGIRPPAGSHNWIPSNTAYLLPGGKAAEITQDKSPAWVGSDSAEVSEFMWQLELVKSQQVQVLGEEMQLTDDGSKKLWYRIAPPQGEFRWVKTSQLSDALPTVSKGTGVQLASYAEESNPTPVTEKGKPESGKVVWSDERKSLEQVEAQIQREQAEIQRKMEADGIRVSIDSPKLEVKQSGNPFKLATARNHATVASEPEPPHEILESSPKGMTRIRPIPESKNQRRTKQLPQSMDHQLDGQRQWEAMQSADPKLRVRPVGKLLGLLGFSIIEADRAPVSIQIAQQYHSAPSQGNAGRIGPIGNSRLDRLPRPGNRPSMTLPSDGSETLGFPEGLESNMQQTMQQPIQQGETTFSRWINSREPIFGPSQPAYNPVVAATGIQTAPQTNSFANPYAMQPQAGSNSDTTQWHGLTSARRSNGVQSIAESIVSHGVDNEDVEQFRTLEIQSALVRLTQEVTGPTEEWNFSALKSQAASWVENGATAVVRGEARLLIERIERFESLRQRTLGLAQGASMIAQQSIGNASTNIIRQASSVSPVPAVHAGTAGGGSVETNAVATNTNHDGDASGWLVQVHTTIKGQPEFALTDDAGKVITYVQSSPSLNLRRYLQQPVTVYGVRGYIPNLAAKQILAERVVRMR